MLASVRKSMGYLMLSEAHYLLVVSIVADQIAEGERLDDVLVGSAYLGGVRAKLFDRPGTPEDLAFALSAFTWWPFKPGPPERVETALRSIRRDAFRDAADVENLADVRHHPLNRIIPESTLGLSMSELYAIQQDDVGAFLAVAEA